MNDRKKLGFEILLGKFCSNYGRFLLINLLFLIPLGLSMGLSILVYKYILHIVPVSLLLFVIPASPFLSGVVVLTRDIYKGEKPDNYLKAYLKAVKENGLKFLLAGILLYIAMIGCYFSIVLYGAMLPAGWLFGVFLGLSVLIAVFFLFMFFGLFVIIPTFDLKFTYALKNSALMTFGELKKNFFALLSILLYLIVALIPIVSIFNLAGTFSLPVIRAMLIGYIFFSMLILIPAQLSFFLNYFLYDNLVSVMGEKPQRELTKEEREEKCSENKQKILEEITESEVDTEKLLSGDDEGYVFYQGKMIKRKALRTLLSQGEGE